MFIRRENRAGKAYVYRMLLSFKTSVTYEIFFLNLHQTTAPVVKQFSSDTTRFFAGHCPISDANMQALAL